MNTTKEKYQFERQQKKIVKEREKRKHKLKRIFKIIFLILILGGGAMAGLYWFVTTKPTVPESEIISKEGIHWHCDLAIKILGESQDIPANIGHGITKRYIHTHDSDGVIHLEFPSSVKKNDIRLAQFFEIWGKKFNKDCILDKCNGSEGKLKMLINGKENSEFENYAMKDGDKIEIIFE